MPLVLKETDHASSAHQKLAEIKTHLARDLEELGLIVKHSWNSNGAIVSFENRDGTASSPIHVEIRKSALIGQKPTWEGSTLLEYEFERIPVGSNGWILQQCYGPAEKYPLPAEGEKAMNLLKEMIREAGIIFSSRHGGNYTTDQDFGIMYNALEEELNGATIVCERDAGIESCSFVHVDGSNWRVALENRKAVLYVNTELIGKTDTSKIGMLVASHVMNVAEYSPFRR